MDGPRFSGTAPGGLSVYCAVKIFSGTDFCLLIRNKSFGKGGGTEGSLQASKRGASAP